jgi:hypothetical protein
LTFVLRFDRLSATDTENGIDEAIGYCLIHYASLELSEIIIKVKTTLRPEQASMVASASRTRCLKWTARHGERTHVADYGNSVLRIIDNSLRHQWPADEERTQIGSKAGQRRGWARNISSTALRVMEGRQKVTGQRPSSSERRRRI